MPSATVNATAEKFAQIVAALRDKLDDEAIEGLTDAQVWKYDLKGYYTEMKFKYDRQQAQGAVAPDPDVVDVT